MRALLVIAGKDLRLLLRRPLDAFFVFAFPVLFAAFFTQVVSGSAAGATRVPLAVVDEARSPRSTHLVSRLLADPGLRARVRSRADAEDELRRGRLGAFVLFPTGFGAGGGREVVLGVDPARRGEAGLVEGALLRLAAADAAPERHPLAGSVLAGAERGRPAPAPASGARPPQPLAVTTWTAAEVSARAPTPGAVTLPQGLAWGLMACAAAFGTSLVSERRRGTLVRLRTSPAPTSLILAGKGLACFVAGLAVCALLLALARPLFGVEAARWPQLGVVAVCAVGCFVGLMVLIGVLGQSEETTFRVAWAGLLVLAMAGGAMVPGYLFPDWLAAVSELSPVRWTITAFEGALWRGADWSELLGSCAALVSLGGAAFVLALTLFRWQEG